MCTTPNENDDDEGGGGDYHVQALVFKHLTDSGLTSSHERRHCRGDLLGIGDDYGIYHAACMQLGLRLKFKMR